MFVKPITKAELTDAQFATLTAVANRSGERAIRFADTRTVTTLTALARRGLVTLNWGPVDGRPRGITSATVLTAGHNTLAREATRRAALADYEARMAAVLTPASTPTLTITTDPAGQVEAVAASPSIVCRMDPFDVIRTGTRREVEIPF